VTPILEVDVRGQTIGFDESNVMYIPEQKAPNYFCVSQVLQLVHLRYLASWRLFQNELGLGYW
jgi:hypothetical protein